MVADTVEAALALQPVAGSGFLVLAPSLAGINQKDLQERLLPGENRVIEERLLAAIAQVIENFYRQNDFPAATALIPPQNISGGIVRVALLLGKIRNIKVAGNRWFSESLLREKLQIEHGEIVRVSEMNRSLDWTNSSPFRRVRMHIDPVPNTGEVDLIINVQERAPFRFSLSYDNTGNEVIGENRYTAAATYGNLWGRDHQLTYQFLGSDDVGLFRAHAMEYRAPLPWHHIITASASYARVNPTLLEGLITQVAESYSTDLRYVASFTKNRWKGELSGTLSFKRTNNNLEFGGTPALNATTDILIGTLAAVGVREDSRGRWLASIHVNGAPGRFNSRSTAEAYFDSRIGASPQFAFTQISAVRLTRLTPHVTSTLRGAYQLASTNLMPSEQLSFGGLSSVRGYKERILSGDGGYAITHEIQRRLPTVSLGRRKTEFDSAVVAFWDYGRVTIKHPLPRQNKSDYIASVGLGFRASIATNFSASIDYGRQLEEIEIPGEPHHRVHVKLTLAY